ncbi:unnamed protein product [Tuber aestivum]|uniref:Uncharacterized protein n=1 Tax=Tuber aestivum TaxID=59557 RepID=A0A292Q441_9PEZI|nr:unnamed protein product [Tuber aestivum]
MSVAPLLLVQFVQPYLPQDHPSGTINTLGANSRTSFVQQTASSGTKAALEVMARS